MEPRAGLSADWTAGFEAGVAEAQGQYEPRIATLEARIAELEVKIAQLQARPTPPAAPVKTSQNSSLPPSSDPPSAPKRQPKHPTGRKRGAQKGHRGHARQMVSSDQIDEVVDHHPRSCPKCQAALSSELPDALPPLRHQVWELPKVKPLVTEHRSHTVECPECHRLVKAANSQVPTEVFGPRATALAGVLHGRWRLSVRETATVLDVVCGLPISSGGVAGLCNDTSQALQRLHAEIAQQVRAESAVHVDETSWRQAGSRPWLWVMRGKRATYLRVLRRRNAEALRELLGDEYAGTVISDRHRAYNCLRVEKREVCWAHLRRDFQSFADWGGATGAWGKRLLVVEEAVFREWQRFRAGQLDRVGLLLALAPWQAQLRSLLEAGRKLAVAQGFSEDLLKLWPALWTFAERGGVEPTNNEAERALRPAVLWRKGCFGAFSDWGNQFVERILSVAATCRQQGLDLLNTVTEAIIVWRTAAPQPA